MPAAPAPIPPLSPSRADAAKGVARPTSAASVSSRDKRRRKSLSSVSNAVSDFILAIRHNPLIATKNDRSNQTNRAAEVNTCIHSSRNLVTFVLKYKHVLIGVDNLLLQDYECPASISL
jgi:hypothetical protein